MVSIINPPTGKVLGHAGSGFGAGGLTSRSGVVVVVVSIRVKEWQAYLGQQTMKLSTCFESQYEH